MNYIMYFEMSDQNIFFCTEVGICIGKMYFLRRIEGVKDRNVSVIGIDKNITILQGRKRH